MRSFVLIIFIAVILTGITSAQRCINGRHIRCGSACPITCNNHRSPPRFCTYNCVPGCQCNRGAIGGMSYGTGLATTVSDPKTAPNFLFELNL
ncbi:unnamed protein product [Oppiella nova]|uniref:TIL domain-containing protein n=1 Tax=Oppiella nova TaxID=334625 RepID=A0A7R9QU74_9ACAR|nr:unnamed protein product [Oppiella nova]CAG2175810.1 unnamed protein product [Oppiella nova]